MENSRHVKINLIGKPDIPVTKSFLKWATNIGRIIIVVTELVALSALLYRFTVDRKIIDLHDQIKKAQLFVDAQAAKEADYRSIQTRLQSVDSIEKATKTKIGIMNNILDSINKGEFTSSNLSVTDNAIGINGAAVSIFALNNFIENLKQNTNVNSISLDDVSSSGQGVKFKLSIELKGDKKAL